MANKQVQALLKFLHIVERVVGVIRFDPPNFWQALAGQDDLGTTDQSGKETVNLLQVHGVFAIRSEEQFLQSVELLIGEPVRKVVHARSYFINAVLKGHGFRGCGKKTQTSKLGILRNDDSTTYE
jgi:hypothetical protein